ncbi:MAG: M15 family metallopeptidase [bacterium]|nr:M15 family metallopeptidase [bacterium]
MKKRRLKLKKPVLIFLKTLMAIFVVGLILLGIYSYQVHDLRKLGYSKISSRNILFGGKKEYVLKVGSSKLLNVAFESPFYDEKNLDSYAKIEYQKQENIIKNINDLIEKGYSNNDISIILAHGNDDDVSNFAKRDKVKYLEEFYSISYAKLKYYDRYVEYSRQTGEDEETTVLFVNLGMDGEEYVDYNVIEDFSIDMLVNKYNRVSQDFLPTDLVEIKSPYASDLGKEASRIAVLAFKEMYDAASKEGLGLVINSAYRSYDDQVELCEAYRLLYGDSYVEKYVASPGFSEHQTGLAFDIGSTTSNIFAESLEYKWMLDNAYKYGFILRFPKSGQSITGFRSEPWHYRYVGKEIATYIYEHNITLEEYYAEFLA